MKTETNKPMNDETMNTPTIEVDAIKPTITEAIPSESTTIGPVKDNSERLTELATKIRDAQAKEHEADSIVVDWKARQLKAAIEMGEYLIEAKSLLPSKKFVKWCRESVPDLGQRTLNRYMKVALNQDKSHVSQAKGLREAYQGCSQADRETESTEEDDLQSTHEDDRHKDFEKIQRELSKAIKLLNPAQDPCEEANVICDLVDALNAWVTAYRAKAAGHSLIKSQNSGVEIPMSLGKQLHDVLETNAEHYVTAE